MAKRHKIPKVIRKNKLPSVWVGALGLFGIAMILAYGASVLAVIGTMWIVFKLLKKMFIVGK